ncbi:hypothetical protein C0J52_18510 [Blattella germanica]|nr:hypothetical protein C0J52_18510 [Blattella germanica]
MECCLLSTLQRKGFKDGFSTSYKGLNVSRNTLKHKNENKKFTHFLPKKYHPPP